MALPILAQSNQPHQNPVKSCLVGHFLCLGAAHPPLLIYGNWVSAINSIESPIKKNDMGTFLKPLKFAS